MPKAALQKRGIALFLSLVMVAVVVILANIVLNIMLSQSKLTNHQIKRIQAYYAGLAGMNYALEKLRIGPPTGWYYVSPADHSCVNLGDCPVTDPAAFPPSIQAINIILCPSGSTCTPATQTCNPPSGLLFCINSSVQYSSE